jgi:hypothetical protein
LEIVSILPQLKADFSGAFGPACDERSNNEFTLIDPDAAPGFFGQKDLVVPERYRSA